MKNKYDQIHSANMKFSTNKICFFKKDKLITNAEGDRIRTSWILLLAYLVVSGTGRNLKENTGYATAKFCKRHATIRTRKNTVQGLA